MTKRDKTLRSICRLSKPLRQTTTAPLRLSQVPDLTNKWISSAAQSVRPTEDAHPTNFTSGILNLYKVIELNFGLYLSPSAEQICSSDLKTLNPPWVDLYLQQMQRSFYGKYSIKSDVT